ncbi:MAG: DUF4215 domain-containing protein [Candidatus Peribacteraceae bacterium]|nr:DUF4215 domain-containing protein [Candidatus Peribacteraceae bacterium]
MPSHTHRIPVAATASLLMVLALAVTLGSRLTAATDCVGKPYGYPGCPTRPPVASSSSSKSGFCGNAIVDEGEQCDKGRFNGKTDCSMECRVLYCGDGVTSKDVGEECDPETEEFYVEDAKGNLTTEIRFTGNDQCGWYCQPPTCTEDGACTGGCKMKYIGECPLSSSVSSESSAHAAAPESASSAVPLSSSSEAASAAPAACGDGSVQKGEECDDGNTEDADGCSNACELPRCGDGIVHKREECDAGKNNSDLTPNVCRTNCSAPRCGDGVIDAGEQCDTDGRNSDTQPNACRTTCKAPVCGDSVVDKGEQCDAGTLNSDNAPNACRTTCRIASCGDGVMDTGETCDDGNRSDIDQCTNACKKPSCGDGVVHPGEQCDWGTKNSDTQPNSCRTSCKQPKCGDTVIDEGEICDGGEECAKDCKPKPVAVATSSRSASSLRRAAGDVSEPPQPSGLADTALPAVLGAFGVLVIASVLFFRRRIVSLFSGKGARSIDDIPLDQIEMPWHRW